ncbi:MAG TPA: endoribonuclease MazF [Bryobacteraceae bacterium]|nr:endoribonuclease MazF [Bryobacteraceae bacterium]
MGTAGRQGSLVARHYVPDAGDLVWLTFDPQAGREQAGRRPALVLSPAVYNRRSGLALVCPITSQVKGYPFEVPLPAEAPVTGVILADHIKSVDWRARRATRAGRAPSALLADVLDRLAPLLGL